jgi:hypothetical protein
VFPTLSRTVADPVLWYELDLCNKENATAATVTITKGPALIIVAAGVMIAVAIAVALLGLHIQVLCLQFVHVILNDLKVSTRFELA